MKRITAVESCALALSISLVAGCCNCRSYDKEVMMPLEASLVDLSAAIEGHVRYDRSLPASISGEELLNIVNEDNSQLLEPFEEYLLKVQTVNKHAIVLVCTKDGRTGLLEDAGCTAQLDKHLWETDPAAPCESTLKTDEICVK